MGLVFKNANQIALSIKEKRPLLEKAIVRALYDIGVRCVNQALKATEGIWVSDLMGEYKNRTGNERSSIGFIIAKNGGMIEYYGFTPPEGYTMTADKGTEMGFGLAKEVSSGIPNGYCLVVVAGMQYSAALESKNYDVLTSAQYLMDRELPIMLKKATETI
jgi:hypothetical protein